MKFEYFSGEQRSPEWFALRLGKVTASRLDDWLAVSKAKGKEGTPLKKRLDYEKELLFERKFNVSYDNFVSSAMQDGIDYEPFIREQYQEITGNTVVEVGAWHNEFFVGSPDGGVNDEGLLEIKIVQENSFSSILTDGVPQKWWRQCQGQLWPSGRAWCDFVAANLKTKKIKIIRIFPDKEFFEWIELSITEELHTTDAIFDMENVHDFTSEAPELEKDENLGF